MVEMRGVEPLSENPNNLKYSYAIVYLFLIFSITTRLSVVADLHIPEGCTGVLASTTNFLNLSKKSEELMLSLSSNLIRLPSSRYVVLVIHNSYN